MNKTVAETLSYLTLCQQWLSKLPRLSCEIILAPPYTGEVSGRMLCEAGCQYVIIGHSERRNHFNENDSTITHKVQAALGANLTPILCVGENAKERLEGKTLQVIQRQVKEGLSRMDGGASHCMIAYEPIWAIGTGKTPTPFEVEQVHQKIARTLIDIGFKQRAPVIDILYGGSVSVENVAAFMKKPHVDGMLVGGASLSAETFMNIVQVGIGA
ncbi:MAG: triose-phosphate isomerase [Nitrospirae bacterium]|nr:triose-phosphate isomerase [Candidatus Troglogloeales bacterium]